MVDRDRDGVACESYASQVERALAKMVGFEVTPTTASCSTARASAPDASSSRREKVDPDALAVVGKLVKSCVTGMV
jgi:hypothetical protein